MPTLLPSNSKEKYVYDSLGHGRFRLLTLAEPHTGPYTLKTFYFSKEQWPPYFALSYACGSGERSRSLLLGTDHGPRTIHITQTLYDSVETISRALRREFPGHNAPQIWIDALCINQDDPEERRRQLPTMGKIYSGARAVVVWLGHDEDDSGLAIHCIKSLHSRNSDEDNIMALDGRLQDHQIWALRRVLEDMKEIERSRQNFAQSGIPLIDHAIWPALGRLYRRPWLRRLWTYQEALLAKRCVVLCGNRMISWEAFLGVGDALWKTGLLAKGPCPPTRGLNLGNLTTNPLQPFRNRVEDGEGFWSHLNEARRREVTVAVDRVYAVMALSSPEIQLHIPMKYALPRHWSRYCELYVATARALLRTWQGHHVFQHTTSRSKNNNLPSWCPDYNEPPDTTAFALQARAGLNDCHPFWVTTPSDQLGLIEVRGITVDEIGTKVPSDERLWHGSGVLSGVIDPFFATQMRRWLLRCFAAAKARRHRCDLTEAISTLQRVMVGDLSPLDNDEGFPEGYRQQIPELMNHLETIVSITDMADPTRNAAVEAIYRMESLSERMGKIWTNRCFIVTKDMHLGFAHNSAVEGDKVCIFNGGTQVHILRRHPPQDESRTYKYISPGFVDGFMLGEARERLETGEMEGFNLV